MAGPAIEGTQGGPRWPAPATRAKGAGQGRGRWWLKGQAEGKSAKVNKKDKQKIISLRPTKAKQDIFLFYFLYLLLPVS
jgi:hypothetical protein